MATRTARLVQRVLSNIKDEGNRADAREKVLREMDQVQLDVCRRGFALKSQAEINLLATIATYDLGGNIHKITNIIEPSTWTTPLTIVNNPKEWREKKRDSSVASAGYPLYGRVFAGRLELLPPPPAAEVLQLDLALLPESTFDEAADPEVPVKWDDALEWGATARMLKEAPNGDWSIKFEREISRLQHEGLTETTVEKVRRKDSSDTLMF